MEEVAIFLKFSGTTATQCMWNSGLSSWWYTTPFKQSMASLGQVVINRGDNTNCFGNTTIFLDPTNMLWLILGTSKNDFISTAVSPRSFQGSSSSVSYGLMHFPPWKGGKNNTTGDMYHARKSIKLSFLHFGVSLGAMSAMSLVFLVCFPIPGYYYMSFFLVTTVDGRNHGAWKSYRSIRVNSATVSLPALALSKGKVGYPWKSTRDIYQHIPPSYALYNGCTGQCGVINGRRTAVWICLVPLKKGLPTQPHLPFDKPWHLRPKSLTSSKYTDQLFNIPCRQRV